MNIKSFLKASPVKGLALALLAIVGYSCKKEIAEAFQKPVDQKIQWAKNYYENVLSKTEDQLLRPMAIMSTGQKTGMVKANRLELLWDQGYGAKNVFYDFVEMPAKFDQRSTPTFMISANPDEKPVADQKVLAATLDRLVIYKDQKGRINQRLITYIPDAAYLQRHHGNIGHNRINKLDSDFFGYLQYKDWSGKPLFMLRIENGRSVRKFDVSKAQKRSSIPRSPKQLSTGRDKVMVVDVGGGVQPCEQWVITWEWTQWCYYRNANDATPLYCDPPEVSNVNYYPNCPPPIEQPGGGGVVDEPPLCTNPAEFNSGNCIPPTEPVTVPIPDSLKKVKDTCIKSALDLATGINVNNLIKSLFVNKFVGNPEFVVKFRDSVLASTTDGYTPTFQFRYRPDGSQYQYTEIFLNSQVLKGASQEYIVATVYHEILHAYINANYGPLQTMNNDHNRIANEYVAFMIDALMQLFPGLDRADANALTWKGLHESALWQLKTSVDQDSIINRYNEFKTSTRGTKCKRVILPGPIN